MDLQGAKNTIDRLVYERRHLEHLQAAAEIILVAQGQYEGLKRNIAEAEARVAALREETKKIEQQSFDLHSRAEAAARKQVEEAGAEAARMREAARQEVARIKAQATEAQAAHDAFLAQIAADRRARTDDLKALQARVEGLRREEAEIQARLRAVLAPAS